MAVGKSSMARAAKTGAKSGKAKNAGSTTGKAKTVPESTAGRTAVIAAADEAVMRSVVYEECRQVLDRDALPGETFKIGDAMPVYYL
ncbi:MAG: hypothetical protein IJR31_00735 [Lachnospiraceae bacterium]|nr:hypothetical protein [Lachnospiraceae bacterium]